MGLGDFERSKKISKLIVGKEMTREHYDESQKFGKVFKLVIDGLNDVPEDKKSSLVVTSLIMMLSILNKKQTEEALSMIFRSFFDKDGSKELGNMLENMSYLSKNLEKKD